MPRQTLKQRADKRFRAWYKGKQFYGDTQREARAKRDEYKRQVEAGLNVTDITAGEYCAKWLVTYKSSVSDRTQRAWRAMLKKFCAFEAHKTQIGFLPLKQITASDVQAFYNSLGGLSYSTIVQHTTAIKAVFRSAIADRIILFNPTLEVKPPKGEKGTHRAITQEERQLIHNTPHRMRIPALVMLYAGLRRGEMLALDIDRDVDFEKKLIQVHYAVGWTLQSKPFLKSPKTKAGEREIPLLDVLKTELKGLHGRLLEVANQTSLETLWADYMRTLSKAAGKTICFRQHDLRHTYCTMLYDAGVDVKSAQAWMGHTSPQTTLEIYTHLSLSLIHI